MLVSTRVRDRISTSLKQFLPIIQQQKTRDVSEADTVTLVKDLLSGLGGFDKYSELTSEHAVRGTYCDLAVKIDDKIVMLIEIKAIGIALDDRHVKQAVDYAANEGIEWVVLTNGAVWRMYEIIFAKPIDKRLLIEFDLTTIDARKDDQIEQLFLFTKEGFLKGANIELRDRQDASSRFTIAALLLNNESLLSAIRRELHRVVDVLVEEDVILQVMRDEVIKRDTLEGPAAETAAKRVNKREDRPLRASKPDKPSDGQPTPPISPLPASPSSNV